MTDNLRRLLENGFRNIDLPPLDERDLADIQAALDDIIQDERNDAAADELRYADDRP